MGAGASARQARDQELARVPAPLVNAVMLEPGRHGRNPPAPDTSSTDCTDLLLLVYLEEAGEN